MLISLLHLTYMDSVAAAAGDPGGGNGVRKLSLVAN